MKAIILAAGYATRLYPLTINKPKALLKINEKSILDFICEEIETIDEINEIIVISNARFYHQFINWSSNKISSKPITVMNDGTSTDEDKLGAIGDISFLIKERHINESILVIAGDNLIDFSLLDFYKYYLSVSSDCLCVYNLEDEKELQRMGIAIIDENSKVIDFQEKPKYPRSNIAVTACYIYKKDTLPLFDHYLSLGLNKDSPGNFPAWLYSVKPVYAYTFKGTCYDIGTPEAYAEVQRLYKK